MFGKSRPDPRTRESMILQCRVTLRKLELKYRTMLETGNADRQRIKEQKSHQPPPMSGK